MQPLADVYEANMHVERLSSEGNYSRRAPLPTMETGDGWDGRKIRHRAAEEIRRRVRTHQLGPDPALVSLKASLLSLVFP